ncbi:hypothetical protein CHLRE_05g246752v5 [Chlamydomonas reinhardtii]|uniref:Uncharacterized protein n=1 Tax=Chlamydomonas reinhardtii TaxID=3055 RepID=A0A2K3DS36_CHLRE|nr:uncharacterized protein CHLRE_05g246752v5 [Chlamydomonas reinhardtii]PNW83352.1 hypothetical protein CHLRE_05g246752v5 [Chlamydomonas reinhardtii]
MSNSCSLASSDARSRPEPPHAWHGADDDAACGWCFGSDIDGMELAAVSAAEQESSQESAAASALAFKAPA